MSAVHNQITLQALSVLPEKAKKLFAPYKNELLKASGYPDIFADKSMPPGKKAKIDAEADRFLYPDPPKSAFYKKLLALARNPSMAYSLPFANSYMISHYLDNALTSLKEGDIRSAVKFCGVYSHLIGDTAEPVHAVDPVLVDMLLPPSNKNIGLELHSNIEGLCAPVSINGYRPKLLGTTRKRAKMGALIGLDKAFKTGCSLAVPITRALYSGKQKKAIALSSLAQNASARAFADFLYTVFRLHTDGESEASGSLDLRHYPVLSANVDLLYRYGPVVDRSLIPYSNGKTHALAVKKKNGKIKRVKGLGVVPEMAPPFSGEHHREATVHYYVVSGAYETFSAYIGANPLFKNSVLSIRFRVLGDGKELYRSKTFKPSDKAMPVVVRLGKARILTLSVIDVTSPARKDLSLPNVGWATHAVWAEPRLA